MRLGFAAAAAAGMTLAAAHGFILSNLISGIVAWLLPWGDPYLAYRAVWILYLIIGAGVTAVYLSFFVVWAAARGEPPPPSPSPPPDWDLPSVSVVIPAHNEEMKVSAAVRSVLLQDYPRDRLEVVVVDDGSEDYTAEVASRAGARVVRLPHHSGKAAALTVGLEESSGEVVITMDADTVASRQAVRALVSALAEEGVGAASGDVRVTPPLEPNLHTRLQEIEYANSYWLGKTVQDLMGWVLITPGALAAYRREVLVELGEVPGDTVAEDFDLAMESLERRLRVRYVPAAVGWTEPVRDRRTLRSQRLRWYVGGLQVLAKHPHMMLSLRYGRAGLALFLYLLLVEYALPVLGLAGHLAVPIAAAAQWLAGVSVLGVPVGPEFLLAFALFVPLQHAPGMTATAAVLWSRGRRDLLPWVPAYFIYYLLWQSYLKLEALMRFLSGRRVGWRPD